MDNLLNYLKGVDLHSNMVLLKYDSIENKGKCYYNLHSNMVLLKSSLVIVSQRIG